MVKKEQLRIRTTEQLIKARGPVDINMTNWASLEEYRQLRPVDYEGHVAESTNETNTTDTTIEEDSHSG
ncbi:hypothetical protein O4160_02460 [Rhodococcus sp. IEGM 1401]|uniref:hypothetical protein n=1 Tax=unclassified Rhodococcus (in: high G+C Gram-positive bacteria) TaxID=192944 RepID=UPI0022B46E6F|nr:MULTISPECIES: hypothetical protein [unclassified Rhodococcus (in: high G+C Gram-positive bacteria)]MCZ4559699.1 hypothetical protein [Rhodococcus sp. IEGM 1401]MDI9919348.1 hypothetical protein [Rhodococcus sp. IEGM 1372]MDV8032279.1 hypothetical protein [Rhodococcus sp. IEGM 1414]